jgi:hypothetical protein
VRRRSTSCAHAGGAVDEQVEPLAEPTAGGEAQDQGLVEPPGGTLVDILDAGVLLELGLPQAGLQAPILALGELAVGQQAEAFFERCA